MWIRLFKFWVAVSCWHWANIQLDARLTPLTRLLDLFEENISPELYDDNITLYSDACEPNRIFMKDEYDVDYLDSINAFFANLSINIEFADKYVHNKTC